jgi:ribose 1,5-bisphosphokinase PhnN
MRERKPQKEKIKERGRGKRTKISKRLERKLQNNTLNINSSAVPAKP